MLNDVLRKPGFWFVHALLVGTVGYFLVALVVVCLSEGKHLNSDIWLLWGIAAGAFGIGNLLGFIYSTFGSEVERFGEWSKVANTAVASIALADMIREDSAIRIVFRNMAQACGIEGATSVTAAFFVAFLSSGFLMFYTFKQLVLNVLAAESNNTVESIQRSMKALADTDLPDEMEPALAAEALKQVRRNANVESAIDAVLGLNVERYRTEIKALILSDQLALAQRRLQEVLNTHPDDADLLYQAGYVEHLLGRSEEAITYFERATTVPGTPIATWKYLGYLYLWDPNKLERAAECSRVFLEKSPNHGGALLNLACAYGQMGPGAQTRQATLDTLARLLSLDATYRARVKELMKAGEDFGAWVHDPEFIRIVGE